MKGWKHKLSVVVHWYVMYTGGLELTHGDSKLYAYELMNKSNHRLAEYYGCFHKFNLNYNLSFRNSVSDQGFTDLDKLRLSYSKITGIPPFSCNEYYYIYFLFPSQNQSLIVKCAKHRDFFSYIICNSDLFRTMIAAVCGLMLIYIKYV